MTELPRESRTVEYKREVNDYSKLSKTVVAFANGDGGQIIIGVEDGSRKIIGCSSATIDSLLEKIPVSIADSIQPALFPQVYERVIDDKEVLIIQVFPGAQKPYFIASEGMERGVYIRVGAHTRRADGEILEELRLLRSRLGYDEAPIPHCKLSELKLTILPPALQNEQSLISLGMARRDPFSHTLHPTRGGVLMLHESPEMYVPEATVIVSRMRGNQGRDTVESREISGPLSQQSNVVMAILEEWLALNPVMRGAKQEPSNYRLPLNAIRESLNNALFHRQYSVAGPIKVALFSDRLEIFSPGHFAGPFTLQSLGDGASYIRNRVVCLAARRLGFIEKRGTGIRLIQESIAQAGLVKPLFEEGTNWFKVTLFIIPLQELNQSPSEKIMALFEKKSEIRSSDVMAILGVSKATAVACLAKLLNEGRLLKDGNGPSRKYKISGTS